VNLEFSPEERMILEMVRDLVEAELRPLARGLDEESRVPMGLLRKMQDLGLFGLLIAEEYGGAGISTACYAAVIEEISRVCAAAAITLSVHNSVSAFPLQRFGTEEQKRKYLPLLASKWIGAFALTEPEAGSDAARLRLKAEKKDGCYQLSGNKLFVTNGSIADLVLVVGRTAESPEAPHRGLTAFLVERTTPGMAPGKV
jgi:alkylation response protein AidB-like acyl-CoA dehydrogenase